MALLGAHESVAGGLQRAFERINRAGGESLQIFTRNQRQWKPAPLAQTEIDLFRQAHEASGDMPVASHASYLFNLATGKPELLEKSVQGLILEIERCAALGIPHIVLHPGSHGGDGIETGLDRVVLALDRCFRECENKVKVLVETTAGQGTGLGSSFEELAYLTDNTQFPEWVGVCVDTCHIFAAGYELRTPEGYEETMDALQGTVGIDKVCLFHLNDSKKGIGSRIDRHEHIGEGEIGLQGFSHLLRDRRFAGLPMTLETPKGEDLV